MGKRNLKNKFRNAKGLTNDKDMDLDMEGSQNKEDNFKIDEAYIILQKLSSSNYSDRENITSLLSSYEFSTKDEKMKEQLLNRDLCKCLVEKLMDPFIQIRFNTISAIINMIVCYSELDIDSIFLFDVGLLNNIENLFMDYLNNTKNLQVKYTDGEQMKINKLLKNTVDLLLLIIEVYDFDETKNYNKLNFNTIIKCLVEFILNPGSISEDVILNSCFFLANLFSLKVVQVEDTNGNNLINFIEFAKKIISDKNTMSKANPLVVASFICSLFYISCSNVNILGMEFILFLIESIYSNINFGIGKQIDELNLSIQNYIKNADNETNGGMIVESSDNVGSADTADKNNPNLKEKIKHMEENIRATNLYLKTFTDVINSIEFNTQNTNNNSNLIEDEENYDEDLEEDNSNSNNSNEGLDIEKSISAVVIKIFQNENYTSLFKMLKLNFLPNLIKFFDDLTIEEFLLNDFDKMIVIKELLYDLEYYTLSLINNIIQNCEHIFTEQEDYTLLANIGMSIVKRLQIEEYSKNQDFLTVLLTTFRTILDKYKTVLGMLVKQNLGNPDFNFKSLFVILNNNINDSFIKINIIDIIALIFAYPGQHSKEENSEICKLLYNICLNENDMEVVAHVLNAYFDIYKEDDYDSNFILKQNGVIDLMKLGVTEFKARVSKLF